MITKKPGAAVRYNGTTYTIGGEIVATEGSEYHGLFGIITEIRDGSDKETENETPDIYCSFEPPVIPCEIDALEERFENLYGEPKTIDTIAMDAVIMAPEMIRPLSAPPMLQGCHIYLVTEDWAVNGEPGRAVSVAYTNFEDAKRYLAKNLAEELNNGCIPLWKDKGTFMEDFAPEFYECYLAGEYCENHYYIAIEEKAIAASEQFLSEISDLYTASCQVEDFAAQMSGWPEVEQLTEEQYNRLIQDPHLSKRVESALKNNESYWESYWETVSMVAREIVDEYLAEPITQENGG